MKFHLPDAITSLYPTSQWTWTGDNFTDLIWLDQSVSKPNLSDLETERDRLQAEYDNKEYQRQRAAEYPPMADYLDAVYWQSQGDNSKMTAYRAAIEIVKQKYPKGNI